MADGNESELTSETEEISELNGNENQDERSARSPEEEERTRFTPGQVLRFVRVRFPGNAKSFPFLLGKRRVAYGQKVVALSDRGMAVGYVNSFPYEVAYSEELEPVRSISKIAAEEDIQKEKEIYRKQKEAEAYCNDKIHFYRLDMVLTHLEFTQWGKKAVFYFIAPQRVDFRDLVKDLVGQLKMRVELRQISVRDRTAAIGGLGPCGRELCCSSFLTRYGNIGIKMAKNQNLTMNPTKLNGVCGQLKCCIKFEEDVYSHKRSILPEEGEICLLENGDRVKVQRLHLLIEQFEGITDQGKVRRYSINQFNHDLKLPDNYQFPEQFENVTVENDVVIGLDKYEDEMAKKFESEINFDFKEYDNLAFNYFRGLQQDHVLSEKEEEEKYDQRQIWEKEQSTLTPIQNLDLNSDDDDSDEEDDSGDEDEENDLSGQREVFGSEQRSQRDYETNSRSRPKSQNNEFSVQNRPQTDDRSQRDQNRHHSGPRQDNRGPRQDNRGPRQDNRGPRQDDRGPRQDNRGPRQDNRGPRQDNRGPRQDNRGPRQDDRGPRQDNRGPRQDNRGPRQDSRGPRQDNRGPRQDNRGPRQDDRPQTSVRTESSAQTSHERARTEVRPPQKK